VITALTLAALLGYVIAAGAFAAGLRSPREQLTSWATAALALGAGFQAVALLLEALKAGNMPVASFAQSLAFLAWLIALAGLVAIVRLRLVLVGALVAPAVAMVLGAASLMAGHADHSLPQALRSAWLPVHVTLASLGQALFVLSAGVSLLYLLKESRLKARRPLEISDSRLPSLESLDRINYHLLMLGFALLSLAIVTGALWAAATWGRFWSWEPVESWSLVWWILYAALLQSRLAIGIRGRRAARLTIALFAVLLCSYLGVNLLSPGKHGGSFG
jgi:cytochrome c-type biogenesis protein CcsB